jgi:hypothetical protein
MARIFSKSLLLLFAINGMVLLLGCAKQQCACGTFAVRSEIDSTATPFASSGLVSHDSVLNRMGASDSLRQEIAAGRFLLEVQDLNGYTGVQQVKVCAATSEQTAIQYVDGWMKELEELDIEHRVAEVDQQISFLEAERDSLTADLDALTNVIGEMRQNQPLLQLEDLFGNRQEPSSEYAKNMRELDMMEAMMSQVQTHLLLARLKKASITSRMVVMDKAQGCQ